MTADELNADWLQAMKTSFKGSVAPFTYIELSLYIPTNNWIDNITLSFLAINNRKRRWLLGTALYNSSILFLVANLPRCMWSIRRSTKVTLFWISAVRRISSRLLLCEQDIPNFASMYSKLFTSQISNPLQFMQQQTFDKTQPKQC